MYPAETILKQTGKIKNLQLKHLREKKTGVPELKDSSCKAYKVNLVPEKLHKSTKIPKKIEAESVDGGFESDGSSSNMEQTHPCAECGETSNSGDNLRLHIFKAHGKDSSSCLYSVTRPSDEENC